MMVEKKIALIDEILTEWKDIIGKDYEGYKNHVYRMVQCTFSLHNCINDDREKIIIAGCFHDLGLWTEKTVDYLPPSILLVREYLKESQREEWSTEIETMIDMHHKITPYKNKKYSLVEVFRRADLADFSLGLIKGGVPKQSIKELKAEFPNAGFHKMLLKEQGNWLLKHPLNPFPILKW